MVSVFVVVDELGVGGVEGEEGVGGGGVEKLLGALGGVEEFIVV